MTAVRALTRPASLRDGAPGRPGGPGNLGRLAARAARAARAALVTWVLGTGPGSGWSVSFS